MEEVNNVVETQDSPIEIENPAIEVTEPDNSATSPEGVTTPEADINADGDIPHELQVKMGKLISEERKRAKAQAMAAAQLEHERRLAQMRQEMEARFYANQSPTEGTIYDPVTGREEDLSTVRGQVLLRERELMEFERRSKVEQKQLTEKAMEEKLQERLAHGRLQFKDFEETIAKLNPIASREMIMALAESDAPAAILNYVAKEPDVLRKLTEAAEANKPFAQVKIINGLESKLGSKKKLTTSAAPAPTVNGSPKNLNPVDYTSQEALDRLIDEARSSRPSRWNKRRE